MCVIRGITSGRARRVGNVACMQEKRTAYKILVGKSKGNKLVGRARNKQEINIKIYIRENSAEGWRLDSSGLEYGPLAYSCKHGDERFS